MTPRGHLRLESIEHRWPDAPAPGFAGFDLEVAPGSFVAVVGASGSGKSTLLRIAAGLLEPAGGRVVLDGAAVTGRPGHAAWQPQRDGLLPWRSILDNVVLGAELAGVARPEREQQGRRLLERVGLAAVADAWPSTLSGGMRQRVALLRAFLTPSPLLLLDEPFGALDAFTRGDVRTWLQEVWLADGTDAGGRRSVVLVTHDVEEAVLLADRVIVLSSAPVRVAADLAVPIARPRPVEAALSPEVVALRGEVLAALRGSSGGVAVDGVAGSGADPAH